SRHVAMQYVGVLEPGQADERLTRQQQRQNGDRPAAPLGVRDLVGDLVACERRLAHHDDHRSAAVDLLLDDLVGPVAGPEETAMPDGHMGRAQILDQFTSVVAVVTVETEEDPAHDLTALRSAMLASAVVETTVPNTPSTAGIKGIQPAGGSSP